jgi:polyisoprenoid-binding protein YceI
MIFFAVEKFGKANFNITSVQSTGSGTYDVKGKLTIKGITNEISFPATVKQEGNKVIANAKIIVDRTKYDIKFRSKSFFENLGDKTIYDDFELNVQLVANN